MRLRFPVALLGILSLSILLLVGCQHLFSSYHVVNIPTCWLTPDRLLTRNKQ